MQSPATGGLIWPGDRVDVILTQELNEKNAPLARRFVGETVLNDVRVVAVDQSITQGGVASGDNATGRVARTVTLEVTPQQAERAAVAERLGTITLAIRAADGIAEATGHRASVYGGDVSAALAEGGAHGRPSHAGHRGQGRPRSDLPVMNDISGSHCDPRQSGGAISAHGIGLLTRIQ